MIIMIIISSGMWSLPAVPGLELKMSGLLLVLNQHLSQWQFSHTRAHTAGTVYLHGALHVPLCKLLSL